MTDAKARLLQMIADEPHMGGGGFLKAVTKAQKVAKKTKAATKVIEAPSVVIPSKLSDLKEVVRGKMGNYGAKRVERAADEIPNLERMYREEALRQAFTGDNAKGLMTLNPADFEKYATPLMPREKPWPGSGPKKENLPTDEYVNYLAGINEYHDVPFLEINKQEQGLPLVPFISGHEGRHRNRAMAQRGEQAGLIQLLPRSELREPLPRRSQEEYIQALRDELEMTGNIVLPQPSLYPSDAPKRPAIRMPDIYAEGGAVHMAGGGRTPKMPWERYAQPKKEAEMRARPINPVAGAIKSGADYATQLIDKGPSLTNLVGNLVGAVPFVGPDLRKRMEASDISIPTDITFGSNMPAEDYKYGQPMQYKKPGISTTSVPTKDVLEALKVSDLVGTPGLSKVAEDVGYGQMPDPLDLLDAASVAALGYGAVKAGAKGAKAAKQGALSAAKAAERYAEKTVPKVMESGGLGAEMLGAFGQNTKSQAVKPKGGNWVDTEVKNTLSRFKQDEEYSPLLINATKQDLAEYEKNPGLHPEAAAEVERLRRDIAHMEHTNAFNKWVDTKFGGYLRNQMGTPDDPVVKSIDMRTMKAQADLEAGQKRLASLDSRIAEAEKTAVTPDELNQLSGMKRNREQRAAELQSNYDLTVKTMLPFGEENMGYDYIRGTSDTLPSARKAAGFPVEGLAQSRPGKAWEAVTDTNIYSVPAEQFQNAPEKRIARNTALNNYKKFKNEELPQAFEAHVNSLNIPDAEKNRILLGLQDTDNEQGYMLRYVGDDMKKRREEVLDAYYEAQQAVDNTDSKNVADNPYLTKLPPESMVHTPLSMNQLGIDHVLDVLKQDVATGVLKLEDLNKITMEQALKRASEYDLDLAKKSRDSLAQNRSNLPVYKEYPEGHKWVQLTNPGDFAQESEQMGHSVKGYEPPKGSADWSESSGDAGRSNYGHGGWDAIKSGHAKVYSLVDANHKPHVTIEVKSVGMTPEQRTYKVGILAQRLVDEGNTPEKAMAQAEKIYPEGENKQFITQIKGKGNARPVGKYDQYTQDFVKSGKWADVFDLKNTGLIESGGKYFTEPEFAEAAKKYGRMGVQDVPWEVARQRHIDAGIPEDEAFLNWVEGLREGRGRLDIPDEPRMAGGGLLKAISKAQKTAKAVKDAETAMQTFTDIATPVIRSGTRKFDVPAAKTSVIKETGGNWLGGNVEQALKPLKRRTEPRLTNINEQGQAVGPQYGRPMTPEELQSLMADPFYVNNQALNKWIDSNLTNYVKKQMATPDDPIRKLAEEGVIHIPINNANRFHAVGIRKMHDGKQMGKSEAAQAWEDESDIAIYPGTVNEIKRVKEVGGPGADRYEPWMEKADPNTVVSRTTRNFSTQDLGFDHIVDVLKEDLAAGRIRPEQLNKISMEQAVRRTYEYDQEMAKKMRETQAKVTEGMPVHKDYSDKGYKWIELKAPDYNSLPFEERKQMIARLTEEAKQKGLTPEDYIERYPESQLAEALKYEGNTMGHCVGGYCPDVLEGRSRIFSLRDAKGEPHVTVEVEPNQNPYPVSGEAFARLTPAEKAQYGEYVRQWRRRNPDVEELTDEHTAQALKEAGVAPQPDRIVQIKGKQNRAPKEDYLPFVQDFVKSGNWSDVDELQNAGLRNISDVFNNTEQAFLKSKGVDLKPYIADDEITRYQELFKQTPSEPGMAEGGEVKSFFEEKSAKQRLLDMIAEEPHMGNGVRPSRLQLQGEIANDTYGGIGGGGRATYTHPIGSDAAIRAYMEGGGYKPKNMDYKGQVNNMGVSYEKEFKDGGEVHMGLGGAALKARKVAEAAEAAKKAAEAAAKAAKVVPTPAAPAFIPGLTQKSTATEIGREERARRQAAAEAEAARVAAAKQTPVPVGYVKHTEKSPNPHVGYRYEATQHPGIAQPIPIDLAKLEREKKGASLGVMPWDSQSRNVEVSSISGEPLQTHLYTHAGQPYSLDEKHLAKLIGGASAEEVADAIKTRDMFAAKENRERGGTGEVVHAVTTMGQYGENYSHPPSDFAFEIINRRLQEGKLTKKDLQELNNSIRTFQDKKKQVEQGIFPYANFAGFETPEGLQQIYTGGLGLNTSSGNLRKAIAAKLHKVGTQELLGFNSEDLINATTVPSLRGVDKGYLGGTLLSNDIGNAGFYGPRQNRFGMELAPAEGFPYNSPYSTDFSARYYGQLPDLVPLDVVMHRQLAPIEQGLLARENKKPYTAKSLRNSAIGSLEKSNEGVSQIMDARFFQDLADYFDALNKPLEKKKGGLAQTKKVKRHGNTVSN